MNALTLPIRFARTDGDRRPRVGLLLGLTQGHASIQAERRPPKGARIELDVGLGPALGRLRCTGVVEPGRQTLGSDARPVFQLALELSDALGPAVDALHDAAPPAVALDPHGKLAWPLGAGDWRVSREADARSLCAWVGTRWVGARAALGEVTTAVGHLAPKAAHMARIQELSSRLHAAQAEVAPLTYHRQLLAPSTGVPTAEMPDAPEVGGRSFVDLRWLDVIAAQMRIIDALEAVGWHLDALDARATAGVATARRDLARASTLLAEKAAESGSATPPSWVTQAREQLAQLEAFVDHVLWWASAAQAEERDDAAPARAPARSAPAAAPAKRAEPARPRPKSFEALDALLGEGAPKSPPPVHRSATPTPRRAPVAAPAGVVVGTVVAPEPRARPSTDVPSRRATPPSAVAARVAEPASSAPGEPPPRPLPAGAAQPSPKTPMLSLDAKFEALLRHEAAAAKVRANDSRDPVSSEAVRRGAPRRKEAAHDGAANENRRLARGLGPNLARFVARVRAAKTSPSFLYTMFAIAALAFSYEQVRGAFVRFEPEVAVTTVDVEALGAHLPVERLERDGGRAILTVTESWGQLERSRRYTDLVEAIAMLAEASARSAVFRTHGGTILATWQDGRIDLR